MVSRRTDEFGAGPALEVLPCATVPLKSRADFSYPNRYHKDPRGSDYKRVLL